MTKTAKHSHDQSASPELLSAHHATHVLAWKVYGPWQDIEPYLAATHAKLAEGRPNVPRRLAQRLEESRRVPVPFSFAEAVGGVPTPQRQRRELAQRLVALEQRLEYLEREEEVPPEEPSLSGIAIGVARRALTRAIEMSPDPVACKARVDVCEADRLYGRFDRAPMRLRELADLRAAREHLVVARDELERRDATPAPDRGVARARALVDLLEAPLRDLDALTRNQAEVSVARAAELSRHALGVLLRVYGGELPPVGLLEVRHVALELLEIVELFEGGLEDGGEVKS